MESNTGGRGMPQTHHHLWHQMNQMPKFQSSPQKPVEGASSKTSPGGIRLKQQSSAKLTSAYVNNASAKPFL